MLKLKTIYYVVAHATILVYQLIALNTAINSYDHSLLTLLLSNQFVEIKGSVFKKFEKDNLFQITCAGACCYPLPLAIIRTRGTDLKLTFSLLSFFLSFCPYVLDPMMKISSNAFSSVSCSSLSPYETLSSSAPRCPLPPHPTPPRRMHRRQRQRWGWEDGPRTRCYPRRSFRCSIGCRV